MSKGSKNGTERTAATAATAPSMMILRRFISLGLQEQFRAGVRGGLSYDIAGKSALSGPKLGLNNGLGHCSIFPIFLRIVQCVTKKLWHLMALGPRPVFRLRSSRLCL